MSQKVPPTYGSAPHPTWMSANIQKFLLCYLNSFIYFVSHNFLSFAKILRSVNLKYRWDGDEIDKLIDSVEERPYLSDISDKDYQKGI